MGTEKTAKDVRRGDFVNEFSIGGTVGRKIDKFHPAGKDSAEKRTMGVEVLTLGAKFMVWLNSAELFNGLPLEGELVLLQGRLYSGGKGIGLEVNTVLKG